VVVLEATTAFEDRVRGETIQPWGVVEARLLGVERVLLDAGAQVNGLLRHFADGFQTTDLPMSTMVPGIEGALNIGHPSACEALLAAAEKAGATVVRGTSDVVITPGRQPSVAYRRADAGHETRTKLIVGADGRSSVVRRQAGIGIARQRAISCISGLLIDDLIDVPTGFDALVASHDEFFVLFHQGGGRARAYICSGLSARGRFSGPDRTARFLAGCEVKAFPWGDKVALGTPAGPVRTYQGDDTWTPHPYTDGVVLIGDAAGYNDPIIAQGLSIAFRDARTVRDLVLDGAQTPEAFVPYGKERIQRMARLRFTADVVAAAYAEDAENRPARRDYLATEIASANPLIMQLLMGAFAGPELISDEVLDPQVLAIIRTQ
jgi:2-polyprenyl-6-methoxyphenol hydroxylase-like FAD-dependent oxidoreductase